MAHRFKLAATLVTGALALGAQAMGSAPASAAPDGEDLQGKGGVSAMSTETYRNEATGECLDDLGRLTTYECDGTNEQDWQVTHWNDGTVRFRNMDSGDCLSDSGGTLGTSDCNSSEAQSFYVRHWDDGTMRFKNESSGQCVKGFSDSEVGSSTCDMSEAQSWY